MIKFIPFYRELGSQGIVFEGVRAVVFIHFFRVLSSHRQREQKQNRHLCFI